MDSHQVVFHVRVQAIRSSGGKVYRLIPRGVTQGKPGDLDRDTISVRFVVRIPEAAFEPFSPSTVIDIPLDAVERGSLVIVEPVAAGDQ